MPLVDRLYRWLENGPAPECDNTLACALERAEPAWARRMVQTLRRRGGVAAQAGLFVRYGDLPNDLRAELHSNRERLHAAIEAAFKLPCESVRFHTLRVLERDPTTSLLYQTSACLRDPDPKVRILAARVLRTTVDAYLSAFDDDPPCDSERERVVKALEEALRTFPVHHRLEALEACLWFARDLAELLWQILESNRLRLRDIVIKHLPNWDHPRLAAFLFRCLRSRRWRKSAVDVLSRWHTPAELTAILRQTDLLDERSFRAQLSVIREPRWFDSGPPNLPDVQPALRRHAPRWVRCVGIPEVHKLDLLSAWLHGRDEALHRAAAYALADLNHAQCDYLFRQVAGGDSRLAPFARWFLHGRQSGLVRSRSASTAAAVAAPAPSRPAARPLDAPDFNLLWQECRRIASAERAEQIEALREHVEAWEAQIQVNLNSPDPRDRVLALQVVSTRELAIRFRSDLERLLHDPLQSIRKLACTLLRTISAPPAQNVARGGDRGMNAATSSSDARRERLRALLEELAEDGSDPPDADAARQIHDLLRDVYGTEPRSGGATEGSP